MRLRGVALVNRSTVPGITPMFLRLIAAACCIQLSRDVGPAYGREPVPVVYAENAEAVPAGYSIAYFVDNDADVPGALAYHTENTDGTYCLFVLVMTILENDGSLSEGVNSISTACSHEIVEMFGNATVNGWHDDSKGGGVADELADPVEAQSYEIEVSIQGASGLVPVSNFVYPDWFDPQAPPTAQFDHMGKLTAPFQLADGGYMIIRDERGKERQVFSESFPKWKRDLKATVGRRARARADAVVPPPPDTIPDPKLEL